MLLSLPQSNIQTLQSENTARSNPSRQGALAESVREPLLEAPKAPPLPKVPKIFDAIAWCESRGRQFDENGKVIRGDENPNDIGKYQINEAIWGAEAKKLRYDIYTEEGNEAMAFEIYQRYGVDPWVHSRVCWDK